MAWSAAEPAIPASIAGLARSVLRSMLLGTIRLTLVFAATLIAGVLGTVVLAQQAKVPPPLTPEPGPFPRRMSSARQAATPGQAGPKTASRALLPQFQALVLSTSKIKSKFKPSNA